MQHQEASMLFEPVYGPYMPLSYVTNGTKRAKIIFLTIFECAEPNAVWC